MFNLSTVPQVKSRSTSFHEDIFAEEPEKAAWPTSIPISKASGSGINYTSEVKSDSSPSSNSGDGFVFRSDSNSLKRDFQKRGSSSGENVPEEASLSPKPSGLIARESLLPSIYDDDAQSGDPSGSFEKKDFRSSFKKTIDPSSNSRESSESKREKAAGAESSADLSKGRKSSPTKRSGSEERRSRKSLSDRRPRSTRSRSRERSRRSRSRSFGRRTRSPKNDRRRSRSRERLSEKNRRHSRTRRSRSKDSRRRSTSRSKDSRRRSRSRSYERRRRHGRRSSSRDRYRRRRYSRSRSHSRSRGSGGRKPGSLSLSSGGAMTPQMALQQTMAAMSAKAEALTGIALPKYYNPAAVNPLKYAEQVQKRKLLWQPKKEVEVEQPKNTVWDKMTFAQDQDGKMTAKFRKLMGIKSETADAEQQEKESVLQKQEELFRDLDQQYEMARMTTHTQRGVGLGYSAQALFPPAQK